MQSDTDFLIINPQNELEFEGPFNSPVVSFIMLKNNSSAGYVCFKLKTTEPKRYCVRPNSGFIPPKGTETVQVLLQPFAFNPTEKNKHKFMVQSVLMPDVSPPGEDVWKNVNPEKIKNVKLKCVFKLPKSSGDQVTQEAEQAKEQAVEPESQTAPPKAPLSGLGGDLQKTASEMVNLRLEEMKLRNETSALKEQLARLRHEENACHSYSPPRDHSAFAQGTVPAYYIAISVAVAILALLFGKYVL